MAWEQSRPISHPTGNAVTSEHTTTCYAEKISFPDSVQPCAVVQAWSKDVQIALEAGLLIYLSQNSDEVVRLILL